MYTTGCFQVLSELKTSLYKTTSRSLKVRAAQLWWAAEHTEDGRALKYGRKPVFRNECCT